MNQLRVASGRSSSALSAAAEFVCLALLIGGVAVAMAFAAVAAVTIGAFVLAVAAALHLIGRQARPATVRRTPTGWVVEAKARHL